MSTTAGDALRRMGEKKLEFAQYQRQVKDAAVRRAKEIFVQQMRDKASRKHDETMAGDRREFETGKAEIADANDLLDLYHPSDTLGITGGQRGLDGLQMLQDAMQPRDETRMMPTPEPMMSPGGREVPGMQQLGLAPETRTVPGAQPRLLSEVKEQGKYTLEQLKGAQRTIQTLLKKRNTDAGMGDIAANPAEYMRQYNAACAITGDKPIPEDAVFNLPEYLQSKIGYKDAQTVDKQAATEVKKEQVRFSKEVKTPLYQQQMKTSGAREDQIRWYTQHSQNMEPHTIRALQALTGSRQAGTAATQVNTQQKTLLWDIVWNKAQLDNEYADLRNQGLLQENSSGIESKKLKLKMDLQKAVEWSPRDDAGNLKGDAALFYSEMEEGIDALSVPNSLSPREPQQAPALDSSAAPTAAGGEFVASDEIIKNHPKGAWGAFADQVSNLPDGRDKTLLQRLINSKTGDPAAMLKELRGE